MRFNYFAATIAVLSLMIGAPAKAQEKLEAQDLPQSWQYASDFSQTVPTEDNWWQQFGDTMLDSLIAAGIEQNYDVLQAQRRIEMARQAIRQAQAAYYPGFSLSGGWTRSRTSGMTGKEPAAAMTGSYYNLGVDMSWELDIFGKITAKARQQKSAYSATRAEYAATMVSIVAKIATNYMQLRTTQSELTVMERHIAKQKRVLEITEARYEAGISSMLDVSQARTTYYSTQASITNLQASETATINALAILLGVFPSDIDATLRVRGPLPDYHHLVSVGVPMELLRRRPDVVSAEYSLAADAAAVGIAKKDFLPTISISGQIGTSAHDIDNLFKKQSIGYTIAPQLSWTIFDGFARCAQVKSAKEQMQASIDNYNLTLLNAVGEVETAMNAYQQDLKYIEILDQVVTEANHSLELSIDLYKQGLTTFINVTDSQITLLQYANELVLAQGGALTALINLYQALGGGYELQ